MITRQLVQQQQERLEAAARLDLRAVLCLTARPPAGGRPAATPLRAALGRTRAPRAAAWRRRLRVR